MNKIDLYKAFFTSESKNYVKKFENFENGQKIQFNFYAGFFGLGWFLYRRMYNQAIIIFLSRLILSGLVIVFLRLTYINLIDPNLIQLLITSIITFIILGLLGNYLYFLKAKRYVERYVAEINPDIMDYKVLDKARIKGGISYNSVFIYYGLIFLLFIISMVMGFLKQ